MTEVTDINALAADARTAEQKVAEALARMGQIYTDTFTSDMIPIVEKFSGITMPKTGKVVATATLEPTGVVMNVVLEYDNRYPDAFEEAQRIIFSMFFEKVVSQMDSYKL